MKTLTLRTGIAAAAVVLLLTGCSANVDAKPADAPAPEDLQSQLPGVAVKTIEGEVNVEANASNGATVNASAEGTETTLASDDESDQNSEDESDEDGGKTGNTMTVTCDAPYVVSTDASYLRIGGDCPSITVRANKSNIQFEGAGELTILGEGNVVNGQRADKVGISGENNNLKLTTSGDLTVSGPSNYVNADEAGEITVESDTNNIQVAEADDLLVSGNGNVIGVKTKNGTVKNSGSNNNIS
ncbi:MAG: DUF3060 domain-containing protein [Arachnia propionica]|uniref:DUF3060 domain-containing protein n=1 Tax=Arachnia propionica TaxID=1750 RepID=UPI0027000616|nr:DUF3060 domain-containing protein [Arachnia propionica]